MNITNIILTLIGSSITIFIELLSYSRVSNNILKFNTKNIFLIIIAGILVSINIYTTSNALLRICISFILLLIISLLVFKDSFSKSGFYTLIVYMVATIYEIILSIIYLKIGISSFDIFENNIFVKFIFSLITLGLTFITLNNKYIRIYLDKVYQKLKYSKIIILIFSIGLFALFILDFKYLLTFSKNIYFGNILLVICMISLIIINMYNYIRINKEIEKTEVLLNFMSKYEKIIDDDRINRHEMLNNLLSLKIIKNKNTKEFEDHLNELIKMYSNNDFTIKNIHKLPSGLKGIFYYKLYGLKDKNYNLNINISKQLNNKLKNIDNKDYIILCKIVGILLDNAIEAAENTIEKYIGIEIYKEKELLIISIDNSYVGKIDISKIKNKNYSTKGKNRGFGLFILNNLLTQTKNMILEQYEENNYFVSKITIK